MVGVRVVDVALLVVWLLWFFRLRDDGDDTGGPGGGGGAGPSSDPPARPWPTRLRDHGSPATRRTYARRGTPRRPARTPVGPPLR
jgi:hypothetical protein